MSSARGSFMRPAIGAPTFDVARIGADGRAVIAGRAAPGAKVVLLDGGKEIAHGKADTRGEWVLLAQDPPLSPGQHELRVIEHIEGRAPVTSDQVVVAVVPSPQDQAVGEGEKDVRNEAGLLLHREQAGADVVRQFVDWRRGKTFCRWLCHVEVPPAPHCVASGGT